MTRLWHSNEGRKIVCAQKHFKAVGLEYRFVDDVDPYWYVNKKDNYAEILFGDKNTLADAAKKKVEYNSADGIWGMAAEKTSGYESSKKTE